MAQQYQVRFFQIPRWAAILFGIAALAFAIALFLLSLTVLLIALPVLAVIGGLYYLFGLPRGRRGEGGRAPGELAEPVLGDVHARERVVDMGVEAGGHDEDVRLEAVDRGRDRVVERMEVLLVA